MSKLTAAALAALTPFALLAYPATAQTTVQRTVSTPGGSVTTTHTVDHGVRPEPGTAVVTTHVRQTVTHRHGRMMRSCRTMWRHGQRVRVCHTVRYHD